MTLGDFVAVNAFLIQLYMPLNMLGFAYREISNALVNMESMFGLLDVPAEIADKPGAPALDGERRRDRVRPRRLPLREGAADPARRELPRGAGQHGGDRRARAAPASRRCRASCSASTTSPAGSVRIDGQDIRDVTQESLRAAIGVVPQDTVLFNDTIYYNIAYGRPGATPRGGRGGRPAGAHPRFHHGLAAGLRDDGRRARPEALGRREAAGGDRPHHPQEPAASCCSTRRPARSTRAPSRRSSARSRR